MRRLVWFLLFQMSVFVAAEDQNKATTHEGYVLCAGEKNHEQIPVYLEACQLPVGNLECGQKLTVLERDGPWLRIQTPDRITRYIRSLAVSRANDKLVPFDEKSGVPEGNAPDCSPVYKIGGGVTAPHPIFTPDPEYSIEARKAGYQGVCVLRLIVGADGKTHNIKVVRGLGHGLDEQAIEAVRQWKFTPAMKAGTPVAVQINVEVSFRLYNQPKPNPRR